MQKYLFELNHPKHYYQFKYLIAMLVSEGKEVKILARNKDVLLNILEEEHVVYEIFGKHKKSLKGKIWITFSLLYNYYFIVKKYSPNVILSKASFYASFTGWLLRITSVIFPDSEVVWVTNKIVAPLSSFIITPDNFERNFGKKHHRIHGMFESCYLHPRYFQPASIALQELNLKSPYSLVRFIGWSANHDINQHGFSLAEKLKLVKILQEKGNVYISSEEKLPDELEPFKLKLPVSKIHDVLYFASLYIGDSQTMATEAALLGTPAIRSNSFVGDSDMSNFKLLENKFNLLYNIKSFHKVLEKINEIYAYSDAKELWQKRKNQYFKDIDDPNLEIREVLKSIEK